MNIKEIVINTIKSLPDDSTWDCIQERINFMAGVRKGLREIDEGKGIPIYRNLIKMPLHVFGTKLLI